MELKKRCAPERHGGRQGKQASEPWQGIQTQLLWSPSELRFLQTLRSAETWTKVPSGKGGSLGVLGKDPQALGEGLHPPGQGLQLNIGSFFKNICPFIYLAVPGCSYGTQDPRFSLLPGVSLEWACEPLAAACGI